MGNIPCRLGSGWVLGLHLHGYPVRARGGREVQDLSVTGSPHQGDGRGSMRLNRSFSDKKT